MSKPTHVKPAYYAHVYLELKDIAKQYGYNLCLHGSMARDLDLIAVPWQNGAHECSISKMLHEMADTIGGYLLEENPIPTYYGRQQWVINLNRECVTKDGRWEDPEYYVDISVIPAKI